MNLGIHHVPLGVFVPGTSPIHRLRPGVKLLGLITALLVVNIAVAVTVPRTGCLIGAGFLLLSLAGYLIAKIPGRVARGQLLSPLPLLLFFFALLVWRSGWLPALATLLSVYASVVLATLVTLSTPISGLMDAVERVLKPFERFGLPVEAITFAFSLTIRLIPLIFLTALEVLEAQRARGLTGFANTIKAFGVPLLVRCLVRTKALGEAMLSRGLGD